MLQIDTKSAEGIHDQLVGQVVEQVLAGTMRPGDVLDPIRILAEELELNPNTVAKAYRSLAAGGILEAHGRRGTLVHREARRNAERWVRETLLESAIGLARRALERGLPPSAVRATLEQATDRAELERVSRGRR